MKRFFIIAAACLITVSCGTVKDIQIFGEPASVYSKVMHAVAGNRKSYVTALSDNKTLFRFVNGLRVTGKGKEGKPVYSASFNEYFGKTDGKYFSGAPKFSRPFSLSVLRRKPDTFLVDLKDGQTFVSSEYVEKKYKVKVVLNYVQSKDTILIKKLEIITEPEGAAAVNLKDPTPVIEEAINNAFKKRNSNQPKR